MQVVCATCGHSRDKHPYRHPFKAQEVDCSAKPHHPNVLAEVRRIHALMHAGKSYGFTQALLCDVLRELEQATALLARIGEQEARNSLDRATDRALAAFHDRWERMPASSEDQQWCNGYARALQHVRSNSVPLPIAQEPPK